MSKPDLSVLATVIDVSSRVLSHREVIAITMKVCGKSYADIGKALHLTPQGAEALTKRALKVMEGRNAPLH